ncbi:MAG TPA: hypothetical protein VJS68_02605 [Thermoplasmata archaeon]|nr:hypothetical protein [Thermoplasmata archaeon]
MASVQPGSPLSPGQAEFPARTDFHTEFYVVMAVFLAVIAFAVSLAFVFPDQFGPGMMAGFGPGFSPFWPLLGAVLMVVFVFWILRFVTWGLFSPFTPRHYYHRYRFDPAVGIARERYARGEIGREQYVQLLNELHP